MDPRTTAWFAEDAEIRVYNAGGYLQLIERHLGPVPLPRNLSGATSADLGIDDLLARLRGISAAEFSQALSCDRPPFGGAETRATSGETL